MTRFSPRSLTVAGLLATAPLLAACGSDSTEPAAAAEDTADTVDADAAGESGADPDDATGLRRVSPDEAAASIAADDEVIVLDVRTPDEYAEGHIDDAVLIDFYRSDFVERLAELDPDADYVLYCRSGNRSGQALAAMADLGFRSVQDVDGGVLAWQAAGLPLTTP